MQAIVQERYGSPADLELREVDRPSVGDDEVLVRVRAASVHPDVWHVVCGRPWVLRLMGSGFFRPKYPIPGTDMAGVVDAVGVNVTRFRPGDAVFGETIAKHQWINGGAYAEYVSVREQWLAPKPDNVTFEQAASVPTSGFIALTNLPEAGLLGPGRKVLVNGAGGGVGSLALQIVKSHGAHVTAVDFPNKLGLLRSLGADRVLDATREDFTRGMERYDLVFDVPGNHPFSACRRVLTPEGRYVLVGHEGFGASGGRVLGLFPRFFGLMFLSRFVKQLGRGSAPMPDRSQTLSTLRALLEAGSITPIIDSTYPLRATREAFRRMTEGEPQGKVIITA
jgi:NADPH:quinone reductase-like Zn-dependent oxidoreductase